MSVSASDITSALGSIKMVHAVGSGLLEKCAAVCNKYSIPSAEFACQIEAFLINVSASSLTLELFGKLEAEIQKSKFQPPKHVSSFKAVTPSKPKASSQPASQEKKGHDMFGSQSDGYGSGYESQPGTPGGTPGGGTPGQYEARTNAGQSIPGASLNVALGDRGDFVASDAKPLGNCCRVTTSANDFLNVADRYRFMYTTVEERARAIDKQLLHLQNAMCEAHFIAELQPVGIPSPDLVWVCGRICNEATEGKINRQSIVLEGSLKESGGRRIRLDVSELPDFSIFPGQVICVQGINPSGAVMTARRIVEGKSLPLPRTDPKSLLEMHYSPKLQGGRPLKVRVAAGPYTTSDNLDFQPLQDLLSGVLADQPDVVIMLGPFVDANHPMLRTGAEVLTDSRYDDDDDTVLQKNKKVKTDLHAGTYETLFRERIGKDGFTRFFNSEEDDEAGVASRIATQFVLVPSVGDVFHEFVFPQPPFGDREAIKSSFFAEPFGKLDIPFSKDKDGALKRVHLVSNPCMFRVNEVLFGTCSNDVLFSLSSDETSKISENRLARLSSHVLAQQSFHPQFPTPPTMINSSVPVDFRHAKHWQMSSHSPDVLIMPSKLTPMAKSVHSTLVVNPGFLAKGTAGGSYADICIHPIAENTLREGIAAANADDDAADDDDGGMLHNVVSRSYVNVVKI